MDERLSAVVLVRDYFKPSMQEMKDLTSQDRVQLASAIAAEQGLGADRLNFVPVSY